MEKRLGIYIHIPFCASKCGYCDFYSRAGCDSLMPDYEDALIRHIREAAPTMAGYQIDTVYFGGGTPSYFGAKRICNIFEALKELGLVRRDSEVTMEANPDSMKLRDLKLLRKAGINRISIGMQSANNDILKMIGRRHNFKQVELAVKAAREAGFDNLSLDLIYGLPNQSKSDWVDTLAKAIALKPEHLSCYGLKLEEGTPMHREYFGSPSSPTRTPRRTCTFTPWSFWSVTATSNTRYQISPFPAMNRGITSNTGGSATTWASAPVRPPVWAACGIVI